MQNILRNGRSMALTVMNGAKPFSPLVFFCASATLSTFEICPSYSFVRRVISSRVGFVSCLIYAAIDDWMLPVSLGCNGI
jgi:hypothetical protein